jgi:hypothetical protein
MNIHSYGIYEEIRSKFKELIHKNGLEAEMVRIKVVLLTPEEAIGDPEDKDYPIITGKERIIQAEFRGSFGHAFTDMFGNFDGSLSQIADMELKNNYRRAIFVSALNASMRYLGLVQKSVHCRNEEPRHCSVELSRQIGEKFGQPRVALVGFQPRMLEELSKRYQVRITDLDKNNIGTTKFGITVEGPERTRANLAWCEVALVTGTTLVNNTISDFLIDKPVIFYGVSVSGAAALMGWQNFCHLGH